MGSVGVSARYSRLANFSHIKESVVSVKDSVLYEGLEVEHQKVCSYKKSLIGEKSRRRDIIVSSVWQSLSSSEGNAQSSSWKKKKRHSEFLGGEMRRSCGYDANDDGCKGAKGTQDILGS